ncbi:hypothetical protein B0O99DRAFT_630272 [Bisporella sp. PMI_857]|nr:hypothetical protein B0O99DRAFT_630272 [Bisporella sp. PMI_857]
MEPSLCYVQNYASAKVTDIRAAQELLRQRRDCTITAHSCVMISHHASAGVYLCNEKPESLSPACRDLSSSIDGILTQCAPITGAEGPEVQGQQFWQQGFNIAIRKIGAW